MEALRRGVYKPLGTVTTALVGVLQVSNSEKFLNEPTGDLSG